MDFFTHLLVGVLSALFLLRPFPPEFIMLGGIMAVVPDLDVFIDPMGKRFKKYYLTHRGGSHSYVVGFFISIFIGIIFVLIFEGDYISYLFVGTFFYGIHVTLDLFTTSNVPIFYPLSKKEFSFNIERAINFYVMIQSLLIVLTFVLLNTVSAKWGVFKMFVDFFFFYYLFYFGYKLLTKIYVQYRLPENSFFIPGLLPFVYFTYHRNKKSGSSIYKLKKKIQFIKKSRTVYSNEILDNSKNVEYLAKTMDLSKAFRFFSKWDGIMPYIVENSNQITVYLALAESYHHKNAYYVRASFDKNTGKIISIRDNFDLIRDMRKTNGIKE